MLHPEDKKYADFINSFTPCFMFSPEKKTQVLRRPSFLRSRLNLYKEIVQKSLSLRQATIIHFPEIRLQPDFEETIVK